MEGNADLTPAKLVGHHNPARVLREDYLAITYQDEQAERGIVVLRAPLADLKPAVYERLVDHAVAVTRATRSHEDIRQGSSIRGAIGRIFLDETAETTPEQVLRQIWEDRFILGPAAASPG